VADAIIVSQDKIRIVGSNDNIRSTFGPKGQPGPSLGFANLFRNGAPRPMKMGNIVSLWRYDAAAYDTPTPSNTRPIAI
jgi:hypothetical protein